VPSARPPKLPFKRLGEYDVLAPISEGGMATVWLGRPTEKAEHADRLVALKVIRPEHARNKEFIAMFRDEAAIVSRLSHPNVVAIHELGHDGRQHFLAMEVLRGRTLFELWEAAQARGTRLPREAVAWIGARVADALHHAHEMVDERGQPQSIVHRDVNPANIFITQDGVPKLIDFGLAKARDRLASTAIGVVKGKLAYLAPEQVLGHAADRRADVFALGVTLWELTLDRRLFRDDSDVETIRRVRDAQVPDPRSVDDDYPRALAAAIVRALARDPADRWQTAAELRDALDAFVLEAGGASAERVSALVSELSSTRASAEWETLVDEAAVGPERIRVWDDERQKLTWMNASVEATEQSAGAAAEVVATPDEGTAKDRLDHALVSRLSELDGSDAVGVARAHLEQAIVDELLGDGSAAAQHAEASLRAAPTAVAHEILRRLPHARGVAAAREKLTHLDAEIAECASAQPRADLLAERARLLEASGQKASVVRAAWEQALDSVPLHAAALRGLEASLLAEQAHQALASHLHRMAEAYAADPRLAAWLHVERARVLDRHLAQPDAAKAALVRALELDPGTGPVRAACVAHAAVHGDAAWLVELLLQEAVLEGSGPRAAALEVDAACIVRDRLGNADRAVALLQNAAARPASPASVRRHALEALVALHEAAGRPHEALRARRDRLADTREPRCRAHQLRAVAAVEESLGNRDAAITAVQGALDLSPTDATLAEALDRLLEAASATDRRIDLWTREAAAAEPPRERARLLVRAARLAESLGDAARAIELLRAALVAHPAHDEAVDLLLRMLSPPPSGGAITEARARVTVHAHGAEHAGDPQRRIAHLEAIALLEEETIGDAARAAAVYETVLRIEPHRRIAILGLARTAARAGDGGKLARALLDEAGESRDAPTADALRVRAAEALATIDAERALALVHEVLKRNPSDTAARHVERQLHEAAGRWAQVDASVGAQIEHAADPRARLDLWLARAEVQRTRLGAVPEALASLRAALEIDPGHPAAREALESHLAALADPRAMRDGLVELATREPDAIERARMLARAAEIDEHVLSDDGHAVELLARALADAPGETWIEERRVRVQTRRAGGGHAGEPFTAASDRPDAEASPSIVARLGALWAKAALTPETHPEGDATDQFERILTDAPGDRAALDATMRLALPKVRAGDSEARGLLEAAVRTRLEQASSDTEKAYLHLVIALALDAGEGTRGDHESRRALDHYRKALRVDDRSVVAAAGTARLGAALGDAEASVAAAIAQAHLTSSARQRAVLLVQAASQTLSSQDARFGLRPARLSRAADLLERALDADPEAVPAAALLIAVRGEDGQRELLLAALRAAFERAQSKDAIVNLGAEVARVASIDPPDRVLAIDALRRVLATTPDHAPTLRALVEQYRAQGAWGDAAQALETLARQVRDPQVRLGALLELADLYAHTLKRAPDVERVLRAAIDADPTSLEALRRLTHHLREATPLAAEIVTLLARIADVETEPEKKAAELADLATLHLTTGDTAGAEAALVEAIAQAPTPARIARLVAMHASAPSEQARALAAVVEREHDLDRPDAGSLAALGRLETSLGRWPDAVAHLRLAVGLAPAMHEARAKLAEALVHMRGASDAAAMILSMIDPDASPLLSLGDPAAALATLDAALEGSGRGEEATVARELRAVAGGLDDGAHVALRARRLVVDPSAPVPIALDPATLRTGIVPQPVPPMLFELAAALAGAEGKLVPVDLEELGVGPRDRLLPATGHPLLLLVHRLSTMLAIARPEVVVSPVLALPRVAVKDVPWLVVPESLLAQPEPVQVAALVGPLVRIALSVPWLEDLPGAYAHATLCAAARQVVPGFASELAQGDQLDLIDEMSRRVGKAIGRKQKKALGELAQDLAEMRAPTLADVAAFERLVARTELRAAFVLTGDLLSTLDAARARDGALGAATASVGPAGLRATLGHPVAGDLARFALSPAATTLRWRAGTLWGRKT
jgi:tetratricopeptide (TPR) repeat protein